MDREEKRRKLQEMVLKRLYPSSDEQPNPPKHDNQIHLQMITDSKYEIEETDYLNLGKVLDDIDEFEPEKESSSDASDSGSQIRLTRAQRKRLRKKKLKETASRPRNQIVGPLLPSTTEANNCRDVPEEVDKTDNISENDAMDKPGSGEKPSSNAQKKLKHRRVAKRLNQSTNVDSLNSDTCDQANDP